jgi:hypothetical protein
VTVRRLLVGTGAAAVLSSGVLPWLRFQRSNLSGFRLAELVASVGDEYDVGPPSWLGIAWYALPLAALAAWFVLVTARPVRVVPRLHLPLGLFMVVTSAVFTLAAHRTVGVEAGELVALAGSVLVVAGSVTGVTGGTAVRPTP